jgi:amino acid transporter
VALEWVRLSVIAALALISTTASLVVVHRLWERSDREERRDQVRLFNLVTVLTVSIGVVALYGALLAVTTTGAVLLLPSETFGEAVRSRVGPLDYVALIWLVTSLSTVGGALGAGLEASAEVREAAYPRLTAADPGEDADGNW